MPTPDAVLTVLGCANPYPRPGEPCSGYLLQADGVTVWIDTGPGTFAELHAIWVSHMHPDHRTDLLAAWNLYINAPAHGCPRPTVIGPEGWTQSADSFLARPGAMDEVFETVELREDTTLTVRGLTMTARRMRHGVPTYGLRVTTSSGTVIAYSADTGPCTTLTELASDADLFIAEAGTATDSTGHCTPEDAARAAADADARRLLLTHLAEDLSPDEATRRAAAVAPIKPETAHPGGLRPCRPAGSEAGRVSPRCRALRPATRRSAPGRFRVPGARHGWAFNATTARCSAGAGVQEVASRVAGDDRVRIGAADGPRADPSTSVMAPPRICPRCRQRVPTLPDGVDGSWVEVAVAPECVTVRRFGL